MGTVTGGAVVTGLTLLGLLATSLGGCSSGDEADAEHEGPASSTTAPAVPVLGDRPDPLPEVTPTPRDMRWLGPDVEIPEGATIRTGPEADAAALAVVDEILRDAGAADIVVVAAGAAGATDRTADPAATRGLVVHVGSVSDPEIAAALAAAGVTVPADLPAEGYALAAYRRTDGSAAVVLGGADPAGTFYAAQTLRQLVARGAPGGPAAATVAGVAVVDQPAMALRGTIEGFYGSPWTHEERLDQLAFHGRFKLNTYVYAPKDDPWHRDRWREPYPVDKLDELRALVETAAANHVRFTFAVSPGVSICYSDPADLAALTAKLDAVHALGVRSFSVALDDIDHTRWNCPADAERYGAASTAGAAQAQVDLLNAVQTGFVAARAGVAPLQMVPTEYRGTRDSGYRQVLRDGLDPQVEVMWTGSYVVPAEITVAQAGEAAGTYGRPVLVWDNTPVNDYPPTAGRLILAPYARREPGLSAAVSGIVLNPMNQAGASKVQLVGAADFTWNDAAYDPARAHRAAARHLAGDDTAAVETLLAFFDLEHLAPTSASSGLVSQPQAPALAGHLDAFTAAWDAGDKAGAVAGLRATADLLAGAPARIRAGSVDPLFVADCGPWLDATALWGQALVATLDGLDARLAGDGGAAEVRLAEAAELADQAAAIRTIPGETRPEGPVRVADGVLDRFLDAARALR
ncbi:MAG TPA: beta-N-acetylglucosaminidase domain-containing protein [Acidimicrobiales bacterium]|nr:beta-N-acetylglucosaminidase domain-containing protein [Acidimicrobiales bacterium]